jgi:hypothetical protein
MKTRMLQYKSETRGTWVDACDMHPDHMLNAMRKYADDIDFRFRVVDVDVDVDIDQEPAVHEV